MDKSRYLIIDSGIGGLCVLNGLLKTGINADFFYLSDRKNSPFGEKSKDFLIERASELIDKYSVGMDGVIFACNTLATNCIEELTTSSRLKFYGVRPVRPKGKTLILCTAATKSSDLVSSYADKNVRVFAPKGLVSAIEENFNALICGDCDIFSRYFPEDDGYENVEISCTHFIYLRRIIEKLYPSARISDGVDELLGEICCDCWEKWGKSSRVKNCDINYKKMFLGEDKEINCLFWNKYFTKQKNK